MRKAFSKVKAKLEEATNSSHEAPKVTAPVDTDHLPEQYKIEVNIYRYRKQRGVNLGSWFVLERWICESPFQRAHGPGQSDLDVAMGADAQGILERHWDSWITEADWQWLAEKGINTVRIPIGYYHICGADASLISGTDFSDHGAVFQNAWSRVISALETAYRYGIGVLFDLHAAPGKQNNDSHSGTSNPPAFFDNHKHRAHTTHVLATFLSHLLSFARSHNPPLPNLVGIELLNEPHPNGHADALKDWYLATFRALRTLDPDLLLYIGDCWQPDNYAAFVQHAGTPALTLDHHLYRCFTHEDIGTPAAEHARRLRDWGTGTPQTFARAAGVLQGAGAALVVGEWSAALNPGSLRGAGGQAEERAAKREYVEAQLALFDATCAGWFFWTYKKERGGDTGWSFRDALDAGVFPPGLGRTAYDVGRRAAGREERKAGVRDEALERHKAYWSQYPGNYDHQQLYEGFSIGWDDAVMFVSTCLPGLANQHGQELGFKGPWFKRRAAEHVARRGNSDKDLWEFEHGLSQGYEAAMKDMEAA